MQALGIARIKYSAASGGPRCWSRVASLCSDRFPLCPLWSAWRKHTRHQPRGAERASGLSNRLLRPGRRRYQGHHLKRHSVPLSKAYMMRTIQTRGEENDAQPPSCHGATKPVVNPKREQGPKENGFSETWRSRHLSVDHRTPACGRSPRGDGRIHGRRGGGTVAILWVPVLRLAVM